MTSGFKTFWIILGGLWVLCILAWIALGIAYLIAT